MKPVPHRHPGEVDLCYDAFCVRITTTERNTAILGAGVLGAFLGGVLGGSKDDVLAGAVLGALLGAVSL